MEDTEIEKGKKEGEEEEEKEKKLEVERSQGEYKLSEEYLTPCEAFR